MGLFSAFRQSNEYETELRAFGIEPNSLPPEANAAICQVVSESYNSSYARFARALGSKSEYINGGMRHAAAVVAFCIHGPTRFESAYDLGFRDYGEFDSWVESWINDGAGANWETQTIAILRKFGLLSEEFLFQFNTAIGIK